jgi:hypothetical protein
MFLLYSFLIASVVDRGMVLRLIQTKNYKFVHLLYLHLTGSIKEQGQRLVGSRSGQSTRRLLF